VGQQDSPGNDHDRVYEPYGPNVVEAMHEIGIDISDRRPKRLDVEMQLHADYGVKLACGAECPYVAADVEEWDVPDPADQSLADVREIRDLIEERVKQFIAERLDDVRASATAHRLRLEKLLPSLDAKFAGRRTPAEIRACALKRSLLDIPTRRCVRSCSSSPTARPAHT